MMNRTVKSFGIAVIIIAGVGGGGYYYLSQQAQQRIQAEIKQIEKQFPNLSITYHNADLSVLYNEVTLNKVEVKDNNSQQVYKAEKVLLNPNSKNDFLKIHVQHFYTSFQGSQYTIQQFNIDNLKFDDGAMIIDNGSVQRIYPSKISFDLAQINHLKISDKDGYVLQIGEYQLQNYGLQKNSNQTLQNLKMVVMGSKSRNQFEIKKIDFKGLNLAEQLSVLEPYGKQFNDSNVSLSTLFNQLIIKTHFDLFDIEGFSFNNDTKTEYKINKYQIKNYGVGRKTDQLLKQFLINTDPDIRGQAQLALQKMELNGLNLVDSYVALSKLSNNDNIRSVDEYIIQLANKFVSVVQFDLFNIEDLKYQRDGYGYMNIAQYKIKNFAADRKTDILCKEFDLQTKNPENIKISLGLLNIDQVNLIAFIQQQLQGNVNYEILSDSVTLKDLSILFDGNKFSIDSLHDKLKKESNGNLKDTGKINGLLIAMNNNSFFQALKQMGYDQLILDGAYTLEYNKQQNIWSYNPFKISIKNVGKLSLKISLSFPTHINVSKELSQTNNNPLLGGMSISNYLNKNMGVFAQYKFYQLEAYLQVSELIERALATEAKSKNITPEQVKTEWLNKLDKGMEIANNDFQKQVIQTFKQVINHPKDQVIIMMKPKAPILMGEVRNKDLDTVVKILNLTIKTQPIQ